MRRLIVLVLLSLLTVVGCGSADDPAAREEPDLQRFVSRPDLRPTRLEIRARAPGREPGYLLLAPKKVRGPGGLMIVDDAGELVWYHPLEFPVQATDLRVQRYRGKPVLTWWQGVQPTIGIGAGEFVIADESYRRIATVRTGKGLRGDLHDFVLTPRGTAYVAAYRKRRADLSSVGGPDESFVWDSVIQEIEIPSGRVLFDWRSYDHVPPRESPQRAPARDASWDEPFDYFHINSIDVDEDGDLLVSARNTSAVYKIRRRDGRIVWRLGGTASDFEMGPGTRFAWQHDARRQPDGTITLFDNSAAPKVADHSRALVLRLDERRRTARLVRAHAHPERLLAPHQGNVQRLGNGNLLVGWGGEPFLTEFSRTGSVLLDAKLSVGDTYRAWRFPWSGRPRERPALAASRDGDEVTLHASWNGATEVASWRVLTGAGPGDMRAGATVPKAGFETTLRVSTDAPLVAAEALDRKGRVLATSRAVTPATGE